MNLHELQRAVHVAKDKENTFGGYNYRTAEGILSAIKAVLDDGATIVCDDGLVELAGSVFVESKAILTLADGAQHTTKGYALHPLTKKGMDPSQITGSASSYARKYALSGLVALDDGSADPDAAKNGYQPDVPQFDPVGFAERVGNQIKNAPDLAKLKAAFTEAYNLKGKLPADTYTALEQAKDARKADLEPPKQDEAA